ncbi:MAG TPA: hypothetical protein VNW99_03145 [Cytophagaceae bacterium]|jgi:hypothetical protein|nr:hypothetical protein [Cytophagaceae bacterium]
MDKFKILTEHSPWFILLCLLVGFGYAWLLYQKNAPWNKTINRILFAFRWVLVTILCLLLLGPFIKYFRNYLEKPVIVFAIDNSQSIPNGNDTNGLNVIKDKLSLLSEVLKKKDMNVELQLLNKSASTEDLKSLKFDNPTTNLSQLLKDIQSNYENRNLAGTILISDGIFNQGIAPTYNQYNFPINTLGLGDTIPRRDINVKSVYYNKIAYAGNKFPMLAEIYNTGFKGENVNISLRQNGKVIDKKTIKLSRENGIAEVEFYHTSEEKGLQHYTIEAESLKDEFTFKNNIQHIYIEIIEGRQSILLVALTPHPDIKAIKSAIDKKQNYQLDIYIPGISQLKDNIKYDLVIFHQLPDNASTALNVLDKYVKDNSSVFFIVGPQTNVNYLNTIQNILTINSRPGQKDNVTPSLNKDFEKFKIENEEASIINAYPPLSVGFGEYKVKENSDIILYQKIGNTVSNKPLLVINSNKEKKIGILCGEGIWEWRLREFQDTKDTKVFDEFISNILQYMASKEDKRKFRVYPINNQFLISDRIIFEAETYNDLYEKIYGQKIDLRITDEKGASVSYSFVNNENTSRFEAKGLKPGIYKYYATCKLGGKIEGSGGEFTVKEILLEALSTTADHNLLRMLSSQTKGKFYPATDIDKLVEDMKKSVGRNIIHTNEEFVEAINLIWLFFLLLTLASAEWFLRRYKGGY